MQRQPPENPRRRGGERVYVGDRQEAERVFVEVKLQALLVRARVEQQVVELVEENPRKIIGPEFLQKERPKRQEVGGPEGD